MRRLNTTFTYTHTQLFIPIPLIRTCIPDYITKCRFCLPSIINLKLLRRRGNNMFYLWSCCNSIYISTIMHRLSRTYDRSVRTNRCKDHGADASWKYSARAKAFHWKRKLGGGRRQEQPSFIKRNLKVMCRTWLKRSLHPIHLVFKKVTRLK